MFEHYFSFLVIADVIEVHVKQCLCFVLDEAINCKRPSHSTTLSIAVFWTNRPRRELAHIWGLDPRLSVLSLSAPGQRDGVKNEKTDSWSANRLRKHRSGRVGDHPACEQQARRRVVPRERIHELRHQGWILRRSTRKTHQSWAAITETSKPATASSCSAPKGSRSRVCGSLFLG